MNEREEQNLEDKEPETDNIDRSEETPERTPIDPVTADPTDPEIPIAGNEENLARQYEEILQERDRLSRENQEIKQENASLKERLREIQEAEERERLKFAGLIQEILDRDSESWREDDSEFLQYRERSNYWIEMNHLLSEGLSSAIDLYSDRMNCCGELMRSFEKYPPLYKNLSSRYEGLELVRRMLERLREPLETFQKQPSLPIELVRISEKNLWDIVGKNPEEARVKTELEKKVREIGNARYQTVREWRDLTESLQKQWLHFIERKFLPVLDGIEEGKRHSETLVEDWKKGYPDEIESLGRWLDIYEDLQKILSRVLTELTISTMAIEKGQPVDYLRHEPIAVEPDPDLPHESVKEVARNGYEYTLFGQVLTLRSAQVIVVKNK
jgi:molecular chaperone GrpE (heat shock protein)